MASNGGRSGGLGASGWTLPNSLVTFCFKSPLVVVFYSRHIVGVIPHLSTECLINSNPLVFRCCAPNIVEKIPCPCHFIILMYSEEIVVVFPAPLYPHMRRLFSRGCNRGPTLSVITGYAGTFRTPEQGLKSMICAILSAAFGSGDVPLIFIARPRECIYQY